MLYSLVLVVALPVTQFALLWATVGRLRRLERRHWRDWSVVLLAFAPIVLAYSLFRTFEPLVDIAGLLTDDSNAEEKGRLLGASIPRALTSGCLGSATAGALFGAFLHVESRRRPEANVPTAPFRRTREVLCWLVGLFGWLVLFYLGALFAAGALSLVLRTKGSPDWPAQTVYGLLSAFVTTTTTHVGMKLSPDRTPRRVWLLLLAQGLPAAETYFRGFFLTPLIAWGVTGAVLGVRSSLESRRV